MRILLLLLVAGLAAAAEPTWRVADAFGTTAILRPGWTAWQPLAPGARLAAGDHVRVGTGGIQALVVVGAPGRLVLGPGSRAVVEAQALRLVAGALHAQPQAGLAVLAPGGAPLALAQDGWWEVDGDGLRALAQEPAWSAAWRGATPAGDLGTMRLRGVRDGVVRLVRCAVETTIAEGVATTTLVQDWRWDAEPDAIGPVEADYQLTLPADAAIADYALWVGDRPVPAEVVDRQRAREIFATVRREQQDPALLELTAGNRFRSRIFPLWPSTPRRLRVAWTQPALSGDGRLAWRLPLADADPTPLALSLRVLVRPGVAVRALRCPGLPAAVVHVGDGAATAEFDEPEFRRDRDLVVEADLAPAEGPRAAHRRERDGGWLQVALDPPAPAPRAPRRWLVLCDTSAHADARVRDLQAQVLAGLVQALGADDRVRVAAVDSGWRWIAAEELPGGDASAARLVTALAVESSLGWVAPAIPAGVDTADCEIVWLSSGRVSAPTPDGRAPAAWAELWRGDGRGRRHVVALADAQDAALPAWCRDGVRLACPHPRGVAATVAALLAAAHGAWLADATLQSDGAGLAVEAPSAPVAGAPLVVVARYRGAAPTVLTLVARSGAGPMTVRLPVPPAEDGAGALGRLWAQQRAARLIAAGDAEAEVRALATEFRLVTPWTSLLVLEDAAMRRRFGIEPAVRTRDAVADVEADQAARWALAAAALRARQGWRIGLADQARRRLADIDAMFSGSGGSGAGFLLMAGSGGSHAKGLSFAAESPADGDEVAADGDDGFRDGDVGVAEWSAAPEAPTAAALLAPVTAAREQGWQELESAWWIARTDERSWPSGSGGLAPGWDRQRDPPLHLTVDGTEWLVDRDGWIARFPDGRIAWWRPGSLGVYDGLLGWGVLGEEDQDLGLAPFASLACDGMALLAPMLPGTVIREDDDLVAHDDVAQVRCRIDPERQRVTTIERRRGDHLVDRVEVLGWIRAAGRWWPAEARVVDDRGTVHEQRRFTVAEADPAGLARAWAEVDARLASGRLVWEGRPTAAPPALRSDPALADLLIARPTPDPERRLAAYAAAHPDDPALPFLRDRLEGAEEHLAPLLRAAGTDAVLARRLAHAGLLGDEDLLRLRAHLDTPVLRARVARAELARLDPAQAMAASQAAPEDLALALRALDDQRQDAPAHRERWRRIWSRAHWSVRERDALLARLPDPSDEERRLIAERRRPEDPEQRTAALQAVSGGDAAAAAALLDTARAAAAAADAPRWRWAALATVLHHTAAVLDDRARPRWREALREVRATGDGPLLVGGRLGGTRFDIVGGAYGADVLSVLAQDDALTLLEDRIAQGDPRHCRELAAQTAHPSWNRRFSDPARWRAVIARCLAAADQAQGAARTDWLQTAIALSGDPRSVLAPRWATLDAGTRRRLVGTQPSGESVDAAWMTQVLPMAADHDLIIGQVAWFEDGHRRTRLASALRALPEEPTLPELRQAATQARAGAADTAVAALAGAMRQRPDEPWFALHLGHRLARHDHRDHALLAQVLTAIEAIAPDPLTGARERFAAAMALGGLLAARGDDATRARAEELLSRRAEDPRPECAEARERLLAVLLATGRSDQAAIAVARWRALPHEGIAWTRAAAGLAAERDALDDACRLADSALDRWCPPAFLAALAGWRLGRGAVGDDGRNRDALRADLARLTATGAPREMIVALAEVDAAGRLAAGLGAPTLQEADDWAALDELTDPALAPRLVAALARRSWWRTLVAATERIAERPDERFCRALADAAATAADAQRSAAVLATAALFLPADEVDVATLRRTVRTAMGTPVRGHGDDGTFAWLHRLLQAPSIARCDLPTLLRPWLDLDSHEALVLLHERSAPAAWRELVTRPERWSADDHRLDTLLRDAAARGEATGWEALRTTPAWRGRAHRAWIAALAQRARTDPAAVPPLLADLDAADALAVLEGLSAAELAGLREWFAGWRPAALARALATPGSIADAAALVVLTGAIEGEAAQRALIEQWWRQPPAPAWTASGPRRRALWSAIAHHLRHAARIPALERIHRRQVIEELALSHALPLPPAEAETGDGLVAWAAQQRLSPRLIADLLDAHGGDAAALAGSGALPWWAWTTEALDRLPDHALAPLVEQALRQDDERAWLLRGLRLAARREDGATALALWARIPTAEPTAWAVQAAAAGGLPIQRLEAAQRLHRWLQLLGAAHLEVMDGDPADAERLLAEALAEAGDWRGVLRVLTTQRHRDEADRYALLNACSQPATVVAAWQERRAAGAAERPWLRLTLAWLLLRDGDRDAAARELAAALSTPMGWQALREAERLAEEVGHDELGILARVRAAQAGDDRLWQQRAGELEARPADQLRWLTSLVAWRGEAEGYRRFVRDRLEAEDAGAGPVVGLDAVPGACRAAIALDPDDDAALECAWHLLRRHPAATAAERAALRERIGRGAAPDLMHPGWRTRALEDLETPPAP